MAVLEELRNEGWHISEEGFKLLSDDGKVINPKILIKKALDVDLREIAAPGFPEEVGRCKVEGVPGGIVVQLQKVRNVSAPKANEESGAAPRMLKLTLTDGISTCHAIEIERIPQLTLNTPPGTKILLKLQQEGENIPVANNYLLLTSHRAEVLGGKVTQMFEKWELNRSLAKHKRTLGGDGGPPPWIPFGQKIIRSNPQDKNFKSLQDKDKLSLDSPNPEFEAQRKDAIAEAGRAGAKKVFGGGNRVLLDHNVQQIVDCGFTVEQAEASLRSCNNNVDRALKSLQKNNETTKGADNKRSDKEGGGETRAREGGRGKGTSREGGRGRGHGDDEAVGTGPKPSGKVSLFDFFSDKLPFDEKDKDRFQGGHTRGFERGSRIGVHQRSGGAGLGGAGGGGGGVGGGSRGGRTGERERGGRGGGGGRGKGGERKQGGPGSGPERQPRDRRENHREPPERKGKREDHQNGRPSNSKGPGDRKPPRFSNHKPALQHESAKYVGHTPSSAVSTNSNLGQGGSDWGSALAGRVGMMSLLDCESTPENDMLFGNSTWSNSIRENEEFQSYGQQQQRRPRDAARSANKGQRPSDFNNTFENGVMDGFNTGGQHSMPGRPQNAFSNNFMPNIPAFPFNDNGNTSLSHIPNHGGRSSNARPGSNAAHFDGGGRNNDRSAWPWRQGDKCMAKYWEDERYYNAEVTGVSDKTCVVHFIEYGNHEEVLKDDCIPITDDGISVVLDNVNPMNSSHSRGSLNAVNRMHPGHPMHGANSSKPMQPMNPVNTMNSHASSDSNTIPFQGIMEFRRGGTRPYVKQDNIARERKPQRAQQSMYVPPAQRK